MMRELAVGLTFVSLSIGCDGESSSPSNRAIASAEAGGAAGARADAMTPPADPNPTNAGGLGGSGGAAPMPAPTPSASAPDAAPVAVEGLLGTPTRPQLSEEQAATHTVLAYLAAAGDIDAGLVVDNWDPTAGVGDVSGFVPNFRVAPDSMYPSVQAAINAAMAVGGNARQYIEVEPATYRELVCVPSGAPPITLYSLAADAAQTVIVFDNYSGKPKDVGVAANPCNPNLNGATFGTSGSTTFAAYAAEFQAKNLSFVNDTDEATAASTSVQGVALTIQGDRAILENVRVVGNQDTLFVKSANTSTVSRSYFKNCYVEGDTDFIFGRGTVVLEGCTIHSVTTRTAGGVILAPSTDSRNPLGILVANGTFTGDAGAAAGSTHLGRAWDEGQGDVATYAANVETGIFPNGQATVRQSVIGAHIQSAAPWRAAATTARPYSSVDGTYPANRLYEFRNTGPGSASP